MIEWGKCLVYVALVVWVISPWVRFAVLPGLTPHRGIPLVEWPRDWPRFRQGDS